MGQNELPSLPDQRQTIHDLTLRKHASGLSPPEEDILVHVEVTEEHSIESQSSE